MVYDIDTLRSGIRAMQADVSAHQAAVKELRRRIAEYEKHLAAAKKAARDDDGQG